tara:strand:+ start:1197 stop:4067 length:2871 start_codon:yes stop_codon:yes gene_type:complete
MASTYTTNLGIEKIGTGEQSGTWGDTTNTNFDILDEAVNGIISITLSSAGSSGSPNSLPITDGASSNGRNKFIEFVDGGDLGGTAYVQLTPNDAEKIVHIRNSLSSSRSIIVFQGTYNASNDFEIVNGADVLLKFNGGGSGATVTDVNVDLTVTGLTAASAALTTADINGGTADNVTIGGSTAAVGTFTTANATTVDTTNIEVTNIKAKDGTSAGSIADSTGVVTVASAVLTTADINGGTADNVTIGGSTAAAGTFTTFTSTGIDDNASSTAITITSGNDLGVGVTSPRTGYRVDIQEASDNGVNIQAGNASADIALAVGSASTADKFVIQAGGKVGISATDPQKSLHVLGGVLAASSDGSTSGITIDSTATSGYASTITHSDTGIEFDTGSTLRDFTFDVSGSELMRIDTSSGNVGIGTSSVDAPLHVKVTESSTGSTDPLIRFERFTSGDNAYLDITVDNANNLIGFQSTGSSDGGFTFGGASTERMRIDSSGNVGIGTGATVSGQLHVKESASSNTASVSAQNLVLESNDTNFGMTLLAGSSANSANIFFGNESDNDIGYIQYKHAGDSLRFGVNAAERMRIDSSGNVGIGATSLSNKFTVNGNQVMLASGEIKFADAGNSLVSVIKNGGSSGTSQMQFLVGSTPAEVMRLDSNGDLGVGTTDPTSKLHVSGTSGAGSRIHIESTGAGTSSFDGSGSGLLLTAGGMNTTSKFTPAIQFGSTDPQFTTTNPKVGAAINAVAREAYSQDNDGGMALVFYTTPQAPGTGQTTTERMRVTHDGNLLVGTTSGTLSGAGIKLRPASSGTNSTANCQVTGDGGAGDVGYGLYDTGDSAYKFYVTYAGQIFATSSSITSLSDVSLKENVRDLDKGLDTINALQPRRFDWKNGDGNDIMGFVAQEVEDVLPELVHEYKYTDEETKLALKMSDMIPSMVKAIQELSAQVNELKAEIAALKGA